VDNDKFQELVIKQFGEIQNQFGEIRNQFREVQNQFGEVRNQFGEIRDQFGRVFEKLDQLEQMSMQHHGELELVARQIESLQDTKDISKSKFYLVKAPD
jgi:archaellum component FlaC